MFTMTFHFADILVSAISNDGAEWTMTIADGHLGKSVTVTCSNEQFAAITVLAMGVGEDAMDGYDTEKLYEVARAGLLNVPAELYPIP